MVEHSYVRTEMMAAQTPPGLQTGVVRWMRENLFSSWLNVVLSLLAFYAVYVILATIGPWLLRSVWTGSSLMECRATLTARYGEGTSGACFAVIRERWLMILFGFYPPALYWRPILTMVLLLVALWPVLFSSAPRALLWFSVSFPAVAFWLLWGGSIWFPIFVILGLGAVGYAAMVISQHKGLLVGSLVAVLLFSFVFLNPISMVFTAIEAIVGLWSDEPAHIYAKIYGYDLRNAFPLFPYFVAFFHEHIPLGLRQLRSADLGGFLLSAVIGISGIVFSLPLGVLLALGRQSDLLVVRTVCVAFIEGLRGVPLITLLFVASLLLNYFLPPGTEFDVILRVIIMVTLFSAAYMAEVIRGGLAALPRGQYEAADALGLDYWKAQRLIIMPQALKITIPGIVGQFIGLFKDTTLVSFISLQDPLQLVSSIRANTEWNGIYWELFIFVGFLFFIFCFSMSRYSMYLENKLKTDHR